MDDQTQTAPRHSSFADSDLRVWKLFPVFIGASGLSISEPKLWDGTRPLTLGRLTAATTVGADLLLDDDLVSREHAQIVAKAECACVKDLSSKNGTALNGHSLQPGEAYELGDGDLLRLGDSLVLVRRELALLEDAKVPELIGRSAAIRRVRSAIARCAAANRPVLILGETGTGKGVTAQAIHQLSGRRGRFVAVNCASVPTALAEGLLFGTRKGSFTGAIDRPGFFTEAQGGTLFLDEVGELPVELQAKLLHAIEAGEIIPVGSTRPIPCDARIVAATNRDLEAAISTRAFREDLYARLSSTVLHLPPVRERREDVLLLAKHIAGGELRLSARLATAFVLYAWPRNVREVGNIVSQLSTATETDILRLLEKPGGASLAAQAPKMAAEPRVRTWQSGEPPPTKREITELLERYSGNLKRIEREVGHSRRQFRRWVEQYGMSADDYRTTDRRS